jgi:hypothetical protein
MPSAPTEAHLPPPAASESRRGRADAPRRDHLGREIAVVLAIKLIAIVLLWLAFFRQADAPGPAPAARTVGEHIAAPATPTEAPLVAH